MAVPSAVNITATSTMKISAAGAAVTLAVTFAEPLRISI
jgi:hypothetical protein